MLTFVKKTVIALIFFLFFNGQVRAQWVTITDPAFAYLLSTTGYASCMNGNLMDTTCSVIVNDTAFTLYSSSVNNLDGIQYFDSLKTLDCNQTNSLDSIPALPPTLERLLCGFNNLTSLPPLPVTLEILNCYDNNLTSLPILPASLKLLICNFNSLTSLPALPDSLVFINCQHNNLTLLPPLPISLTTLICNSNILTPSLPALPNSLKMLYCNDNNLSALPALPSGLNMLRCDHNQLSSLPALPDSLSELWCNYNNLTSLPTIPDSLITLICEHNNLTAIPTLPPTLNKLVCGNNSLTSLPLLPPTINELSCEDNNLSILPGLPTVSIFWCQNNQITCLPALPNTISGGSFFNVTGNPFTCLPNYIAAMNSTLLAMPLCEDNDLVNNPNACQGFRGIVGYTYSDNDGNCSLTSADDFTTNIAIELYDSTNTLSSTFYTLGNGIYNYILDTAVYSVHIDTVNKPYTTTCLYPGIDSTFTLTTSNPSAKNVNFDVGCKPGFDVGVKSVNSSGFVFPGLPHQLNVSAGDLTQWYNLHCADGVSGNVTVTVNGPVTFDSIAVNSLTPTNITGNTFTYTIADFGTVNLNAFVLWFTTDTSAQAGNFVCVTIDVTPIVGDMDSTNNHFTYCYPVTNSYDPNDKQVYPTTVNPAYNGYFTYTINFQNVGTAAAQNIRMVDTLASNLDLSTFEIINYSHANISTLTGNVATFRFPNIQLADSVSNPEGSKGFIQYRIKPVANLPFGTQIENKAAIYFDFNAPITTNTAVSTFNSTVGLSPNLSPQEREVMVYPNPGKGIFNLSFSDNSNSLKTIEVFNLIGEKVFSGIAKADNSIVDLSKKENGVYLLRVCNATTVFKQRLIKQ